MKFWMRFPLQIATFAAIGAVSVFALLVGGYFYVEPSLPEAADMRDAASSFSIPMRIYSRDGDLMNIYGEQQRAPVTYEEIPQLIKDAFLAAEDANFFEHSGIDYLGILRGAIYAVTRPGERVPGGSTITQQVARTADLVGRDYSLDRKFREAIIAFRLEREFDKEEIFGLFLNTTFFGQRSNGVAAAARKYFNKELDELTLSEIAIIAGIPQGPSIMNPYYSPDNAAARRAYVLRRMHELGFIDAGQREAALAEPIVSQRFGPEVELSAEWVVQYVIEVVKGRFGDAIAQTEGLMVTTTIDSRLQRAGNQAVHATLEDYDRNHGYRGPIGRFDIESLIEDAVDENASSSEAPLSAALEELLIEYPEEYDAEAAAVVAVNDVFADVYMRSRGIISLGLDSVAWARRFINDNRQGAFPEFMTDVLAAGDIVRFRTSDDGRLVLYQVPDVDGALVSVDPQDGAVVALIGGYSFDRSNFDRATQAGRQPGSAFKPFFYLSALYHGYTLASIINDAPFVEHSITLEETRAVRNFGGGDDYSGEVSLREALTRSLNAVADRIVRDIGPSNAVRYLERFGFSDDALPRNASLALGSGSVTPLELANGYSILANGGHAVGIRADPQAQAMPYLVQRIEDAEGRVLYDASFSVERVCDEPEDITTAALDDPEPRLIERPSDLFPPLRCAEQVESPQRIFLITDVMKDVIKAGSGRRANTAFPSRTDLAGKTGTTTGPRDAWFAGFNADIVAVARVGFDEDTRPLGNNEQGGRTAIPAWIDFMRVALDGMADHALPRPPGIEELRVNPRTGELAADCNPDAYWEYFFDHLPAREPDIACRDRGGTVPSPSAPGESAGPEEIFNITRPEDIFN
jgi:penicillin-binding protein 1A